MDNQSVPSSSTKVRYSDHEFKKVRLALRTKTRLEVVVAVFDGEPGIYLTNGAKSIIVTMETWARLSGNWNRIVDALGSQSGLKVHLPSPLIEPFSDCSFDHTFEVSSAGATFSWTLMPFSQKYFEYDMSYSGTLELSVKQVLALDRCRDRINEQFEVLRVGQQAIRQMFQVLISSFKDFHKVFKPLENREEPCMFVELYSAYRSSLACFKPTRKEFFDEFSGHCPFDLDELLFHCLDNVSYLKAQLSDIM